MEEKEQKSAESFNTDILHLSDIEQSVLGNLIVKKDTYPLVSKILHPHFFYERRHQLIYAAIADLFVKQKAIDMLTVKEQLNKRGELEEIGGLPYIMHLSNDVSPSTQIEYHAHIIVQKYMSRQLLILANEIRLKVFDTTQDIEDLIQQIKGKLADLSTSAMKYDCTQINPMISEAYTLIQRAAKRTDGVSGLATGFTKLDKMTSGWQNGELITIGARPGMGKTSFVLSMLKNMTVNFKIPVALFSLEMNNLQLINRLLTNVCDIPNEKIKSGQLAAYEWQQLEYKLKDILDAPFYVDNTPICKIDELCRKAYYLVKEKKVKLIVIDYIQLLYNNIKYSDNRYLELNYFTRRLKSLAKELNIPIIVTSQMNRGIESREGIEGKRPQLMDLRDSGTLCDDSDIVVFIHRPEYYKIFQDDRGNDLRGMAEIIIAKQRNGAVGDVLLRFKGEYCRFSNPDDEIYISTPDNYFPSSPINPSSNNASSQENNPFRLDNKGPLPF